MKAAVPQHINTKMDNIQAPVSGPDATAVALEPYIERLQASFEGDRFYDSTHGSCSGRRFSATHPIRTSAAEDSHIFNDYGQPFQEDSSTTNKTYEEILEEMNVNFLKDPNTGAYIRPHEINTLDDIQCISDMDMLLSNMQGSHFPKYSVIADPSEVRGMHPIRESPSSDSRKMSTDLDAPNDESAIQSVANEGLWKVSSSHYPERMSQRTQTRDRRLSRAQTLEIRMSSSDHTASEPVAKRRSRHSLKKSYDELPSQSQEGAGLPLANHKSSFF